MKNEKMKNEKEKKNEKRKMKSKNNEKLKKDKWLQLKKMYDNTIKRREGEKAFCLKKKGIQAELLKKKSPKSPEIPPSKQNVGGLKIRIKFAILQFKEFRIEFTALIEQIE